MFEQLKRKVQHRSDIPRVLRAYGLNTNICEVGVRFGYNFQQLLTCQPRLAVGVDHYRVTKVPSQQDTGMSQGELDRLYTDVSMRFIHDPAVRIMRCISEQAAFAFPQRFFDYVYIDADHSYEGAIEDMRLWWARVRQGGIMAGHDHIEMESKNGVPFGVVKAVKDFMKEQKIGQDRFHVTSEGFKTWMLYKVDGE